jgi:hypothetical protein
VATVNDLVAWLTNVLDEDERGFNFRIDQERNLQVEQLQMWGRPLAEMMLADVAAKRAIIGLHSDNNDEACQSYAGNWSYEPCLTLRLLASAYAGRPGYQDQWRP